MTDAKFQKSIDKTLALLQKYKAELAIAENEYHRRYGHYPSDIDDDGWIDCLHIGDQSSLTVDKVDQNAKMCLGVG
jgi:hypothetical protein